MDLTDQHSKFRRCVYLRNEGRFVLVLWFVVQSGCEWFGTVPYLFWGGHDMRAARTSPRFAYWITTHDRGHRAQLRVITPSLRMSSNSNRNSQ
jgi:hypothetical protein